MDQSLLDILACPKCRGTLEPVQSKDKSGLACRACLVVYPIEDEIPVLLAEEALPLEGFAPQDDGKR